MFTKYDKELVTQVTHEQIQVYLTKKNDSSLKMSSYLVLNSSLTYIQNEQS